MVFDASNRESLHSVFARDGAEVRPEAFLDIRAKEWLAVFCAEDVMDVTAQVGVGHGVSFNVNGLRGRGDFFDGEGMAAGWRDR